MATSAESNPIHWSHQGFVGPTQTIGAIAASFAHHPINKTSNPAKSGISSVGSSLNSIPEISSTAHEISTQQEKLAGLRLDVSAPRQCDNFAAGNFICMDAIFPL